MNLKDLALNFLLARAPDQDAARLAERLDGMNRLAHTLGVERDGTSMCFHHLGFADTARCADILRHLLGAGAIIAPTSRKPLAKRNAGCSHSASA